MEIGKYTYGIEHIKLKWENCANLKIGNFCSIADNIQIYLGGNHMSNWISTYPFGIIHKNIFNKIKENEGYINNLTKTNGDVIIGNDVWIGANG
jgi:acetyltransferase-like isoleucine patch superfamily enzyme